METQTGVVVESVLVIGCGDHNTRLGTELNVVNEEINMQQKIRSKVSSSRSFILSFYL